MSLAHWCDTGQHAYSAADPAARTMSMEVPEIKNGVKVGVAYTVERHICGPCADEQEKATAARMQLGASAAGREQGDEHADR